MVQGRATTTKMKRGAVAKRRTARFELKMVSHYYTLRMYVTTVFLEQRTDAKGDPQ